MPFTAEEVNALNAQENAYPLEFFQAFAQQITVYEDDDIWVVDKPVGLLSVDGKTLKVSLLARLERANPAVKLIHRLDMDTSGCSFLPRMPKRKPILVSNSLNVCHKKNIRHASLESGSVSAQRVKYLYQCAMSRR